MIDHVIKLLLPSPYYRKVMEVLFSVKIFYVEFSPDLYVLNPPELKKWFLETGLCVYILRRDEKKYFFFSKRYTVENFPLEKLRKRKFKKKKKYMH